MAFDWQPPEGQGRGQRLLVAALVVLVGALVVVSVLSLLYTLTLGTPAG
jgi:hypothetical protein